MRPGFLLQPITRRTCGRRVQTHGRHGRRVELKCSQQLSGEGAVAERKILLCTACRRTTLRTQSAGARWRRCAAPASRRCAIRSSLPASCRRALSLLPNASGRMCWSGVFVHRCSFRCLCVVQSPARQHQVESRRLEPVRAFNLGPYYSLQPIGSLDSCSSARQVNGGCAGVDAGVRRRQPAARAAACVRGARGARRICLDVLTSLPPPVCKHSKSALFI